MNYVLFHTDVDTLFALPIIGTHLGKVKPIMFICMHLKDQFFPFACLYLSMPLTVHWIPLFSKPFL